MKKRLTFTYISRGFPCLLTVEYRYFTKWFEIPLTLSETMTIQDEFDQEYINKLINYVIYGTEAV